MGRLSDSVQAHVETENVTSDIPDQDDMLGASAVPQQPLPEYHQVGPVHLETFREALADRAQYDKPEDSIYFIPHPDPLVDDVDKLRRHGVYHYQSSPPDGLTAQQYDLLQAYFAAIQQGEWDIVQQLLTSGLVTANTPGAQYHNGCTPLLIAVMAKHKKVIILLLEHGALVDGWSGLTLAPYNKCLRTPLMMAASQGDLPSVKWLMEGYGADDSIIAPDGQLALRLAAEAGHEHVVAYLPVRRGGMYIRWKNKQQKLLKKIGWIGYRAFRFVRLFVYDIPRVIVYTIPRFALYECLWPSIRDGVKWCWQKKHLFLPFMKRQVMQVPEKIARGTRKAVVWLKTVPGKIKRGAVKVWVALCQVPGEIKRILMRISGALRIAWNAIVETVKTVFNSMVHLLQRVFSLLHTAITAIVTFFRTVTLADLIAGIGDLLKTVFVTLPLKLLGLVDKAWKTVCDIIDHFFDCVGWLLYWLGYGIFRFVMYLPEMALRFIGALGEMIGASWKEVRIWWNPKAI